MPRPENALSTVVVDLTPVLPGGENGGAKIFVFELMRSLAAIAPETQFILLTQAAAHEELRVLERRNLRRLMIVGPKEASPLRRRLPGLAARLMQRLPASARGFAMRAGYSLNVRLKRRQHGGLLRSLGADLLFCPFTAPTYFEPGIATVCTIHDVQSMVYPEFFTVEDAAHRDRVFTEACRKATALVAVSDYSRDSAVRHGSIEASRIRTIYHRFAERFAGKEGAGVEVLERLGLESKKYVIYPANFWRHKNHEMLLVAFGMACDAGLDPDIKLVCTGAPSDRSTWLSRAVRAMKLEDRVVFPGFVSHGDLGELMLGCRAMVFPSLFEGFGLPVVEAMASGIPVACSDTTSLPEVAGDATILFDPRIPTQLQDAIERIVADDGLCARLTEAGLARGAEFADPVRMAREYMDLFLHARANVRHENFLTGAYVDGWAGPMLNIQVVRGTVEQTLELELFAPGWLPQEKYLLQVRRNGEARGESHRFGKDETLPVRIRVGRDGGSYQLAISPTIVPQTAGLGPDTRELSVLLKRCSVVDGDASVQLFPQPA